MDIQRKCPLCGDPSAKERSVPKQDKYEVECNTCTLYHLTLEQDKGFIDLPKEDRMALSAYVREQYEKTKIPVHLDWVENFKKIIDDYKSRQRKE